MITCVCAVGEVLCEIQSAESFLIREQFSCIKDTGRFDSLPPPQALWAQDPVGPLDSLGPGLAYGDVGLLGS